MGLECPESELHLAGAKNRKVILYVRRGWGMYTEGQGTVAPYS